MSTNVARVQSFFNLLHRFVLVKLATSSMRVKYLRNFLILSRSVLCNWVLTADYKQHVFSFPRTFTIILRKCGGAYSPKSQAESVIRRCK